MIKFLTERMEKWKSIGKDWSKNRELFWNEIVVKESTELELYKNKYETLFRTMAINELYKFPEFREWVKTHPV